MTKYKNAMSDLNEHSKTNYHTISSERAKDFLKNYENGDQTAEIRFWVGFATTGTGIMI